MMSMLVTVETFKSPRRAEEKVVSIFSIGDNTDDEENKFGFAVIADYWPIENVTKTTLTVTYAYMAFSSNPKMIGNVYNARTPAFSFFVYIEDLRAVKRYIDNDSEHSASFTENSFIPTLFFEERIAELLSLKRGQKLELAQVSGWHPQQKELPKDLLWNESM